MSHPCEFCASPEQAFGPECEEEQEKNEDNEIAVRAREIAGGVGRNDADDETAHQDSSDASETADNHCRKCDYQVCRTEFGIDDLNAMATNAAATPAIAPDAKKTPALIRSTSIPRIAAVSRL